LPLLVEKNVFYNLLYILLVIKGPFGTFASPYWQRQVFDSPKKACFAKQTHLPRQAFPCASKVRVQLFNKCSTYGIKGSKTIKAITGHILFLSLVVRLGEPARQGEVHQRIQMDPNIQKSLQSMFSWTYSASYNYSERSMIFGPGFKIGNK
jgi:hypothetical protein